MRRGREACALAQRRASSRRGPPSLASDGGSDHRPERVRGAASSRRRSDRRRRRRTPAGRRRLLRADRARAACAARPARRRDGRSAPRRPASRRSHLCGGRRRPRRPRAASARRCRRPRRARARRRRGRRRKAVCAKRPCWLRSSAGCDSSLPLVPLVPGTAPPDTVRIVLASEIRRRCWRNRLVRDFRRGIAFAPVRRAPVGRHVGADLGCHIRGPYGLGSTIDRRAPRPLPRTRDFAAEIT